MNLRHISWHSHRVTAPDQSLLWFSLNSVKKQGPYCLLQLFQKGAVFLNSPLPNSIPSSFVSSILYTISN